MFRPIELVDLDRTFRKPGDHLQFPSQGLYDPTQGRNLHVVLVFKFRQARLLDAQCGSQLLLTLARQLSKLAKEQFPEQFLFLVNSLRAIDLLGAPLGRLAWIRDDRYRWVLYWGA